MLENYTIVVGVTLAALLIIASYYIATIALSVWELMSSDDDWDV
jgi:hypothetical protein